MILVLQGVVQVPGELDGVRVSGADAVEENQLYLFPLEPDGPHVCG